MTLPVNLYCDLHVHSCMSDGADTPKEAAAAAAKAGLRTVALTDHNTISGLTEFSAAAKELGLNGICGCEFSTEYAGKELHILGLYLPEEIWPDVRAYTDERNKRKARSNRECTERLAAAGYRVVNIDATVIAQAPKLAPYIFEMRHNVARALGIEIADVSIKATTEEGLGFSGERLGIAAHAVCLIEDL